eukprot:5313743-Prymnesium_polylepis.1
MNCTCGARASGARLLGARTPQIGRERCCEANGMGDGAALSLSPAPSRPRTRRQFLAASHPGGGLARPGSP